MRTEEPLGRVMASVVVSSIDPYHSVRTIGDSVLVGIVWTGDIGQSQQPRFSILQSSLKSTQRRIDRLCRHPTEERE